MLRAKYVASFIGLEKRRGSTEYAAAFVGLYKVGANKRLTSTEFWKIPAYQQLKRCGLQGFRKEDEAERPFVLWFDLTITDFCKKWKGKLKPVAAQTDGEGNCTHFVTGLGRHRTRLPCVEDINTAISSSRRTSLQSLRSSSGSLAMFAAMRRASSWLSSLCDENRLLHTNAAKCA
jgi:hypothetical protein